jgi:predicted Zn-dependent protease
MLGGLLISCSTTRNLSNAATPEKSASTNKNDGSSYEKAVVIKKKHELKGVNAEYVWLRHNYPGYRSKGQSLNFNENKSYDIITIVTADGIEKKIYFDISKFYGKY